MSKVYAAFIPGVPRAWQRPAVGDWRRDARGTWYRPRGTQAADHCWRTHVRAGWLAAVGNLGLSCPVALTLVFVGGRGDLSNRVKSVEDAIGARGWRDGLAPAYQDDSQVVETWARRIPASAADAGVFICIECIAPA